MRVIGRLLRLTLAAQLIGAALAAWLAVHFWGTTLGTPLAAAAGGAVVLGVHPFLIAVYFTISRLARSVPPPELRLPAFAAPAMYLREYGASVRGLDFANAFLGNRPAPSPALPLRPLPILFVHGYFCNRAIWLPLMGASAKRGYRVEAVTLEPVFGSIEQYAAPIERAVVQLLAESGADEVLLVCHSMGGLATRAWMRGFGDARVRHVVMLGSPHAGTVLATYSRAGNLAEMKPGNPWLSALAASESPARRAKLTNVFSYHDDVVAPQESARLDGARNIGLGGLGHVSLMYSRRVWSVLFAELERVEPGLPTSPKPAGVLPTSPRAR
jgi:pimeloyl-ACP methyl ester carboxylesterase